MASIDAVRIETHAPLDPVLTAEEVAEWLSVTKHRVWELTRAGQLQVVILGKRQYRYTRSAVEEFIRRGGLDPSRQSVNQHLFRFKESKND